jgi:hypothetical protein
MKLIVAQVTVEATLGADVARLPRLATRMVFGL